MVLIVLFLSLAHADWNQDLCNKSKFKTEVNLIEGQVSPKYIFAVNKEYICLSIHANSSASLRIENQPMTISISRGETKTISFKPNGSGECRIIVNGLRSDSLFIVKTLQDSDFLEREFEEKKQLRRGYEYRADQNGNVRKKGW